MYALLSLHPTSQQNESASQTRGPASQTHGPGSETRGPVSQYRGPTSQTRRSVDCTAGTGLQCYCPGCKEKGPSMQHGLGGEKVIYGPDQYIDQLVKFFSENIILWQPQEEAEAHFFTMGVLKSNITRRFNMLSGFAVSGQSVVRALKVFASENGWSKMHVANMEQKDSQYHSKFVWGVTLKKCSQQPPKIKKTRFIPLESSSAKKDRNANLSSDHQNQIRIIDGDDCVVICMWTAGFSQLDLVRTFTLDPGSLRLSGLLHGDFQSIPRVASTVGETMFSWRSPCGDRKWETSIQVPMEFTHVEKRVTPSTIYFIVSRDPAPKADSDMEMSSEIGKDDSFVTALPGLQSLEKGHWKRNPTDHPESDSLLSAENQLISAELINSKANRYSTGPADTDTTYTDERYPCIVKNQKDSILIRSHYDKKMKNMNESLVVARRSCFSLGGEKDILSERVSNLERELKEKSALCRRLQEQQHALQQSSSTVDTSMGDVGDQTEQMDIPAHSPRKGMSTRSSKTSHDVELTSLDTPPPLGNTNSTIADLNTKLKKANATIVDLRKKNRSKDTDLLQHVVQLRQRIKTLEHSNLLAKGTHSMYAEKMREYTEEMTNLATRMTQRTNDIKQWPALMPNLAASVASNKIFSTNGLQDLSLRAAFDRTATNTPQSSPVSGNVANGLQSLSMFMANHSQQKSKTSTAASTSNRKVSGNSLKSLSDLVVSHSTQGPQAPFDLHNIQPPPQNVPRLKRPTGELASRSTSQKRFRAI
eukprot:963632_1